MPAPFDNGPGAVRLECPKCGSAGAIAWQNLQGRMRCRRCQQWYRLVNSGLVKTAPPPRETIEVGVRRGFSAYTGHRLAWTGDKIHGMNPGDLPRQQRPRLFTRRRACAAAVGLGLVIVLGVIAVRTLQSPPPPSETPLPQALEERVPLWSEAWLRQDLPQLLRLSEPARDRELRRWLAKNTPAKLVGGKRLPSSVQVASIRLHSGEVAEVTVQASGDNHRRMQLAAQKLVWTRRNGVWYFNPTPAPGRSQS